MTIIFVCRDAWAPPMLTSSEVKYLIRRNNGSVQKVAAEELLNLANVQVPTRGCGLEEIHRFLIFLLHALQL